MRKPAVCVFLAAGILCGTARAQEIRKPVWAGQFYPASREPLTSMIDGFLRQVETSLSSDKDIRAVIAPHAGYVYSGQTAAWAYKQVMGRPYRTVVILAPSHRFGFKGCSIYTQGGFETPLGVAKIDASRAAELARKTGYSFLASAHLQEHAVEVQVPFIQRVLPEARIVPVVMGIPDKKTIDRLAGALAELMAEADVLVVASTDMSHFLPKNEASRLDGETAALLQALNTKELVRKVEKHENIMCGGAPVAAALLAAQRLGPAAVDILAYSDSSDAGAPGDSVVGYLAAAVSISSSNPVLALSEDEQKELLECARAAVTASVRENRIVEYKPRNSSLLDKKGAFVTLKENGQLRGCIGFIEPDFPLYLTVMQAAVYAALNDPRFDAVRAEEVDELEIEISVLSPLRKITDPTLVQVGKHGLLITSGDRKGLLLPQVPVENGWGREAFLQNACLKAGIPRDSWKSGAEIFVFEALVFHEPPKPLPPKPPLDSFGAEAGSSPPARGHQAPLLYFPRFVCYN